jgi:hypothetical protein
VETRLRKQVASGSFGSSAVEKYTKPMKHCFQFGFAQRMITSLDHARLAVLFSMIFVRYFQTQVNSNVRNFD